MKQLSDNEMKSSSIWKLLKLFTIPAVLGLVTHSLYNIVDRIFIGQYVGSDGLASLSLVFPVLVIQFGIALLAGEGGATLIGNYLGKSDKKNAEAILGNTIFLTVAMSTIFMIIGLIYTEEVLRLFSVSDTKLLLLSSSYLKILLLGTPLMSLGFCLDFTIRTEGNPKLASKLMIISALINIILDPVFIIIFKMGVEGAAIATVIAQIFTATAGLKYYMSGKSKLKVKLCNIIPSKKLISSIIAIGMSSFIMDISVGIQQAFLNKELMEYGSSNYVAAIGIFGAISSVYMMLLFGLGDGMMPIISYSYGAKLYVRLKKTFKIVVLISLLSGIISMIIMEIFPNLLASLFINSNNEDLMQITILILKVCSISIPLSVIPVMVTRLAQATNRPHLATFMAPIRQIIIFVPLVIYMSMNMGINGVLYSIPLTDFVATIIIIILYKMQLTTEKISNSNLKTIQA